MSTYEISKSSLLSLKAEILRKQQELLKTKSENETKIRTLKKTAPLEIKNKGIEARQKFDISEEDENLLKKSRETLQAKAKLYEKLVREAKNTHNFSEEELEYHSRFLVRFDRKAAHLDLPPDDEDDVDRYPESEDEIGPAAPLEPPQNPGDEWVEYTDCLGRSRMCLRKDLQYLKSKDRDLEVIVEEKRRNKDTLTADPPPLPPAPSTPPKAPTSAVPEQLRRQWERDEEAIRDKGDIHYQDILFNEARTHGVGYYGFSKDEQERAKQQADLKRLREETREQQQRAQDMKASREKLLKARVKAAMNRKRQRMGLEPLPDDQDEETKVEETTVKEENVPEKSPETKAQERLLEEMRRKHVRPWDKHKKSEHYEYSQDEWVAKRRRVRQDEFAPPTSYHNWAQSRESDRSRDSDSPPPYRSFRGGEKTTEGDRFKPTKIRNELSSDSSSEDECSRRTSGCQVAPPPTYDYYGPSDKSRRAPSSSGNMNESIEAGLKFLRQQMEKHTKNRDNDMFLS